MAHMYQVMVTRKGQDGIQTHEVIALGSTPMKMRAEAYRQAHTVGTMQVMVAEGGEWVGTINGVDSPANPNLWWTEDRRKPLGMRAQAINAKGQLSEVF